MPQWAEALDDEGERRVFLHLDEHGSITEEEATRILGSPRRLRQFSRRFETLLERTPLRVRIQMTGSGKRYVREGRSG
jgi:succinylglutamate desuccinylase